MKYSSVAAVAGTFGPGLIYCGVTVAQIKACGGIRSWAKGGFGATKLELDRLETDIRHEVEEDMSQPGVREDGYNGA